MEVFKFCRVCLVTDVKMYSLDITSNDSIGIMYSDLAQIQVYDSCQHVCFECASLLQKYQMFKLKCCRAHEILSQISADNILTKQMIQNVDRKANKLESSLMFSSTEICCEPFNDFSNNSNSNNINNPSQIFNDPLEIPVQPTEVDISKKEFEPDVAMKCEEQINEELIFINKYDDVIDFSENGLEYSSDMPTKIEINESEQNCEDFGEIDVSLDAASCSLDNVEKNDLINLSVEAKKIPKVVNKLVNCKIEKRKSIINKNTKNRKRKSEIVCNTNDLGTKISRKINKDTDKNLEEYSTIVSISADEARNQLPSRKESRIYKISTFKCEFCYKGYENISAYENHMNMHSVEINNKEGPKCEECGVHFASEMAWKRHLVVSTKHIVDNGCKFCGETFSNVPDLKTHMRINHPTIRRIPVIRSNKYVIKLPGDCPLCKEWLSNRTTYQNHMNKEHPQSEEARILSTKEPKASKKLKPSKAPSHVCEVCGQAFKHQCLLVYHKRRHTGERPYKCDDCGKAFAMLCNLYTHRIEIHLPKVPFKCDMCAKLFSNKRTLTAHIKAHLGFRPHKCTLCDKAFRHAWDLKLHNKFSHSKEPCPKRKIKRNVSKDSSVSVCTFDLRDRAHGPQVAASISCSFHTFYMDSPRTVDAGSRHLWPVCADPKLLTVGYFNNFFSYIY